ncbi:MAG: hypothetical protein HLUCCO02_07105 [Idiomarinaceae bacterium HL-53]|nr:MAG: hypothetical protein HLUCCO02_07105 [Idiomarinaceae bacterium HL-53]CUS47263.1 hypothetical protein Ga0003345_0189 [Idiomarinaceae bacterium HL-53]
MLMQRLTALFIVLFFTVGASIAIADEPLGSWRLKVDPEKTIGFISQELSGEAEEWHKDVELQEFTLDLFSLGFTYIKRGVRLILSASDVYTVTYEGAIVHEEACMFIWEDPVDAYSYRLMEAC